MLSFLHKILWAHLFPCLSRAVLFCSGGELQLLCNIPTSSCRGRFRSWWQKSVPWYFLNLSLLAAISCVAAALPFYTSKKTEVVAGVFPQSPTFVTSWVQSLNSFIMAALRRPRISSFRWMGTLRRLGCRGMAVELSTGTDHSATCFFWLDKISLKSCFPLQWIFYLSPPLPLWLCPGHTPVIQCQKQWPPLRQQLPWWRAQIPVIITQIVLKSEQPCHIVLRLINAWLRMVRRPDVLQLSFLPLLRGSPWLLGHVCHIQILLFLQGQGGPLELERWVMEDDDGSFSCKFEFPAIKPKVFLP